MVNIYDLAMLTFSSVTANHLGLIAAAEKIVVAMKPAAPWSREAWKTTLDKMGIVTHEEPYYNSCALWTTMNMIYSDSAQSIADIIGKPLAEIPAEQMVKAVHSLALDKLKDSDHRFHIRPYFGL